MLEKIWPFNVDERINQKVSEKVSQVHKQYRMYAAARGGRSVDDWVTSASTADSELRSSLMRLRDRSRQLYRDDDYCRSAIRTIVNNVVGRGVRFQAQVKLTRKRGDGLNKDLNDEIERKWKQWKRKENCDVSGKLSFNEIERLILKTAANDGEFVVRYIYEARGKMKVPFSLELIEADLLDENHNQILDNGGQIRMGVELDKWKKPVAYWFLTSHPGDFQHANNRAAMRRRIPAEEILHDFISDRMNQTRGAPWIASAMLRLHHLGGYEQAEVIASRAGASLMGFVESPMGEMPEDDVVDGEKVLDFEPGTWKYLAPGEKVSIPAINRPGGQFEPFVRAVLRGIAAGIGISYESISKDYSQSNYSSSRLALIDDRENYRIIQQWLVANFHQPVFEKWLKLSVLSGELKIADYELNTEKYTDVRWTPRGFSWIDPTKDVAASIAENRAGFKSKTQIIAEAGEDYEEVLEQIAEEKKLAKKLGLIFDTDPEHVDGQGAFQALKAAGAEPEKAPAKKPAAVE